MILTYLQILQDFPSLIAITFYGVMTMYLVGKKSDIANAKIYQLVFIAVFFFFFFLMKFLLSDFLTMQKLENARIPLSSERRLIFHAAS